jgi:NTE family protein
MRYVPDDIKKDPLVRELAGYGCPTRMHVVRLLAPRLDNESLIKDIDFSPAGIRMRWEAGYADTMAALTNQPWIGEWDPLEGVILHEPQAGAEPAAEMEMGDAVTAPADPGSHKLAAE